MDIPATRHGAPLDCAVGRHVNDIKQPHHVTHISVNEPFCASPTKARKKAEVFKKSAMYKNEIEDTIQEALPERWRLSPIGLKNCPLNKTLLYKRSNVPVKSLKIDVSLYINEHPKNFLLPHYNIP